MMIIGADGGNKNLKMFGELGELIFNSELGEYRERNLEQTFSNDDIVFEFKGEKGFAGTLAENESQFSTSIMGDTKAHEEFLIRILLGLHKYTDKTTDFQIVVGQPISKHNASEKAKMKKMLEGGHEITVNDVRKKIHIHRAEVAAEGGASFWSDPRKGKIRIIDFGSGTTNCASLIDGKYIDKDSFTIREGLNTLLTDDVSGLVRHVCIHALRRWDVDDSILLCGGGAEVVYEEVCKYFSNASLLCPTVERNEYGETIRYFLSPVYANAVGFYEIGKKIFR